VIRNLQVEHVWGEVEEPTRTRPLLTRCAPAKGEPVDVFVKLEGRIDYGCHGFVHEVIAGLFARSLGLKPPESVSVTFPPELLPAITDPAIVKDIGASGGPHYGSISLGPAWHTVSEATLQFRDQDRLAEALAIVFFDLITENGDRSPLNPNLLQSKSGLSPIDHEASFSNFPFVSDADIFRPWESGSFRRAAEFVRRHVLYAPLVGRNLDFPRIAEALRKIPPRKIRSFAGQIPFPWIISPGTTDRICAHLVEARKHTQTLTDLVKHALRKQ